MRNHLVDRCPGRQPGGEHMQAMQMPQHRPDNRYRGFAFLKDPAEHPIEPGRVALGGGHDRVVQFERRAVADREARILEFDPAAVAGIERELFELGAGQQPIAAEMLNKKLAGVAARGHPVRRARCHG